MLACATIAGAQTRIVVPAGPAPTIDGNMKPTEWRRALVVHTSHAEIYFLHDAAYLYIAIKSKEPGFASVCLSHADTVTVLQGPWAVGFGTYLRSKGEYRLLRGFDWQLRGDGKGAEAAEARKAYVRGWGYLATTLPMNEREKEMQIALSHLQTDPTPIAIIYRPNTGNYWGWPASPQDDCGGPRLLAGIDLQPATFEPATWAKISISRGPASQVPADLSLR